MPSTEFAREAIAEFLGQLRARTGADAEIVSYPEDDSGNPLTVDAVARVGGELWAIDHMRLAYEPTVIPAGDEAVQMLRGPLKELADRYGCCLHVGVLPPRRRARIRPKIDAYYSDVLRRAEAAVISGEDWFDLDGFTSVQILKGGVRPDAEKVEVATWLGESASVEDQVVAALEGPLTAKLRGQLAAAKRADHRVMLLIDQVPDPTRRQPTVFLASWQTVKMVVDRVVTSLPGVVDCVWFRAGDGSFTNLTSPSTC